MKYWIVAAHVFLAVPAIAMDARHPDWPCPQIVVPKLSVAAFWTGPSIDDVGDTWMKDQTVHDLVLRFAGRRTSLAEAEKEAAEFIVGTQAERQQRAKLLFAGLFATLGRERDDVMAGIERFSQRQQQLREKISAEMTDLRAQQDAAGQESEPRTSFQNRLPGRPAFSMNVETRSAMCAKCPQRSNGDFSRWLAQFNKNWTKPACSSQMQTG